MPPSPWWKPRRASNEPNIARSEATRMSQASAVSSPPASAQPLTAAMIGFPIRCMPRVKPFRPSSTISRIGPGWRCR